MPKDITIILTITLFTIMLWVGFEAYSVYLSAELTLPKEEILRPIDPQLNTEVTKTR